MTKEKIYIPDGDNPDIYHEAILFPNGKIKLTGIIKNSKGEIIKI